jgi:hypothetical protein
MGRNTVYLVTKKGIFRILVSFNSVTSWPRGLNWIFLNFVLVEFVLTALKEFEISFYFCQNLKKKTRVPRYKKGKSIFIIFVLLQFSLQILSSDKSFVCTTFQATNYDKLIITQFVLYYYWKKLWFFYCLSVRVPPVPRYMWISKTLRFFIDKIF